MSLFFVLVGCTNKTNFNTSISSQNDKFTASITLPNLQTYVNANNVSAFAASGDCNLNSYNFQVKISDAKLSTTQSITCDNFHWSTTSLNFSSFSDGAVSLVLLDESNNILNSVSLTKETIIPDIELLNFQNTSSGIRFISPGIPSTIIWKGQDDNLSDFPFSVELSQDDGITFQVLAKLSKNTFLYNFIPDNSLVCILFCKLRIKAEDQAGNFAYSTSVSISKESTDINISNMTLLELHHPGELTQSTGYEVGSSSINYTGGATNNSLYRTSIADDNLKNQNNITNYSVDLGGVSSSLRYAPRNFDLLQFRKTFQAATSDHAVFDAAMYATWNTADFTNGASTGGWTYTGEGSQKITFDGIKNYGLPYPISLEENGILKLSYRANDSLSAGGHPRVQLNSFQMPAQKRLVFDMSVQLGDKGSEDSTWPLYPTAGVASGEDSILIFQLKSEGMLDVDTGTSNQPSLAVIVDRDPVNIGKLRLILNRCKWNPCSDSTWAFSQPNPSGQRYSDTLTVVSNLNRGEPIDFLIDTCFDWNSNCWIKFVVNGKKYNLNSSFTPPLDTNYNSGLRTIPLQRFDMTNSPNKVAINAPYSMSLGMYMFNVATPVNINRIQYWRRARVLTDNTSVATSSTPINICSRFHPGHQIRVTDAVIRNNDGLASLQYNLTHYNLTNITGFTYQIDWGMLESTQGVYDWSRLDAALALVKNYNKYLRVRVQDRTFWTGCNTAFIPAYVSREAKYSSSTPDTTTCYAKVWETATMDQYIAMMTVLVNRYKLNPFFMGVTTEEMALDSITMHTNFNLYTDLYNNNKRLATAINAVDPTVLFTQYLNWPLYNQITYFNSMADNLVALKGAGSVGWPDSIVANQSTWNWYDIARNYYNKLVVAPSIEYPTTSNDVPTALSETEAVYQMLKSDLHASIIVWDTWNNSTLGNNYFYQVVMGTINNHQGELEGTICPYAQ